MISPQRVPCPRLAQGSEGSRGGEASSRCRELSVNGEMDGQDTDAARGIE